MFRHLQLYGIMMILYNCAYSCCVFIMMIFMVMFVVGWATSNDRSCMQTHPAQHSRWDLKFHYIASSNVQSIAADCQNLEKSGVATFESAVYSKAR